MPNWAMSRHIFALQIVLVIAVLAEWNSNKMRYRARADMRHKDTAILLELQTQSLDACTSYCTWLSVCNSVSYMPGDGTCYISSNHTLDDRGHTFIPFALEVVSGWTAMSKILYPVVQLVGPHATKYQLDYKEARQVCSNYGTEVAAPEDLLAARWLSYHKCACGWLSNGKNGFVIQRFVESCWPSFTKDIIYCGKSKANVYCKS